MALLKDMWRGMKRRVTNIFMPCIRGIDSYRLFYVF